MFPGGWPGAGLFVLRLAVAIPFLIGGSSELWPLPHDWVYVRLLEIGVGSLLLIGLWTPVMEALQIFIELWILFSRGGALSTHLLLTALGLSLLMLGPGAFSVDARLFGRKRIDIRIP